MPGVATFFAASADHRLGARARTGASASHVSGRRGRPGHGPGSRSPPGTAATASARRDRRTEPDCGLCARRMHTCDAICMHTCYMYAYDLYMCARRMRTCDAIICMHTYYMYAMQYVCVHTICVACVHAMQPSTLAAGRN
jgi:hypothetical protein